MGIAVQLGLIDVIVDSFSEREAGIGVSGHSRISRVGIPRGRGGHAANRVHAQHGRRHARTTRMVGQRIHWLRINHLRTGKEGRR